MKEFDEKYLAAIDLGSSKVGICVALEQDGNLNVVHYSEVPSEGVLSSAIYIPMLTAKAVKEAVHQAEEALMTKITGVVVGMPRNDVVQLTVSGTLKRDDPDEYVTPEEVRAIKATALESYPLPNPEKQAIYGAIAQSFTIEDGPQLSEREVVGTLTPTLEGNFKVFVGRRQAVQAIEKIFKGTGITLLKKYFIPEVIGRSVLSREELKNGVALVDIGAGVTSLSIYKGNIMRYYASIPFGGKTVTEDIETECSLDDDLAEKIKKRFGFCMPERLGKNGEKILQIRLTDPYKEIPVRYVSEVVTARYRELLDAILFHIGESGLQNGLRGGIVLTGGGAEQKGLETMVRELSGYNVRKGYPKYHFSAPAGCSVCRPSASAAVGMILAAHDEDLPDCAAEDQGVKTVPPKDPPAETPSEPLPDELFPGEGIVEVEAPAGKGARSGARGGGRRAKAAPPDDGEKTGTLPLIWKTVGDALLRWYDREQQQ